MDGDDWIESNMLEELVKKQQESGAEIVTSGAYRGVGEQCTKKVDSLNEGIILKAIYKSRKDKTIVFVSHRESTLSHCDRVIHMESNRVS